VVIKSQAFVIQISPLLISTQSIKSLFPVSVLNSTNH